MTGLGAISHRPTAPSQAWTPHPSADEETAREFNPLHTTSESSQHTYKPRQYIISFKICYPRRLMSAHTTYLPISPGLALPSEPGTCTAHEKERGFCLEFMHPIPEGLVRQKKQKPGPRPAEGCSPHQEGADQYSWNLAIRQSQDLVAELMQPLTIPFNTEVFLTLFAIL